MIPIYIIRFLLEHEIKLKDLLFAKQILGAYVCFIRWEHTYHLFQESNILKLPHKSSVKNDLHKNEYFNKILATSFKN